LLSRDSRVEVSVHVVAPSSSIVDPVADAWSWLTAELEGEPVPPFIVLLGLGHGYLLDALERHAPSTRVLALEPDPATAAAFRARRNWQDWLTGGRLVYLVDPDYSGAAEAWRIFPTGGGEPTVLVHPDLVLAAGVARASQALKKILFGVEANAEARRRFAPRYLLNSIRNLPGIVAGSDVRALTDAYRGVPAVIVAAGPSLDNAIEDLGDVSTRALLIATDTALRPLLSAGIVPPLVVGLDPSTSNLRHFLALPECRETWLVSESALDRSATAIFDERSLWFRASNHHPWPWLNELGIDVGQLDVWGSVLTAAFQVACLAGCDPIVVVGADLAFTDGRPYARGTTFELDWAWAAAHGTSLECSWQAQVERAQPRDVPDLRGGETKTSESLLSFRDWMVARAGRSGRRVINATGAGILFGDGIEQGTLADAPHEPCEIPPVEAFVRRSSKLGPSAVAERLRQVRGTLDREKLATPLDEWQTFSGNGFDVVEMGRALEEAAHALETRRDGPSVAHLVPWSQLSCPGRIHDFLVQLPEAVRAFRAGLSGDDPVPFPFPVQDRLHLLRDALRVLQMIRDAVERIEHLDAPGGGTSDLPVSARYAWPDTTRWAILTFEALLGATGLPATGPRLSPFFTAPVRLTNSGTGQAETALSSPVHASTALSDQWARCAAGLNDVDTAALRLLLGSDGLTPALPTPMNEAAQARMLTGSAVMEPRPLTDQGLARSTVSYSVAEGVVCVTPYSHQSFLVRPDGSTSPCQTWPRPIIGQLPLGESGTVAWGNGIPGLPQTVVGAAYVMYRRHGSDDVTIEELSVRPTFGAWSEGRLYWNCFPTPVDSWTGLASWSPGEPATREVPDVLLFGIHAGEGNVGLHPCAFKTGVGYERRLVTQGWTWHPATGLRPLALGPNGAASAHAVSETWTATAHPEADLVAFESRDGRRLSMTCYYPLRMAWAGPSLLVSTAEREVLLFEGLMDVLDRRTNS
jgi:hypothetical protein